MARKSKPTVEDDKEPDDENLATFKKLQNWFKESADNTSDWREQAMDDYDFVAGHQWTDEEKRLLQEQLRPVVAFNRIDPMIAAILGTELQNRQQIKYSPREQGDVKVNEVLTSTAEWARDLCDAEFAESDSFGDLIICGMGWCEGNMDYVETPEGMYTENRIDPIEMYWDTAAKKKNLKDGRFNFRAKTMPKIDAIDEFPEADPEILHAAWADVNLDGSVGEVKNPNDSYKDKEVKDDRSLVTIVEAQWWEKETYYQIIDPQDGQLKEFSIDDFKALQKRYKDLGVPDVKNVRRQRKVYKQAFLGSEIIETNEIDCKQFKYKAMTGKRDRNKNVYYGLVRGMKDPQRWANKWLSQTMHIINSNAKGGVEVETDAVPNARKFEKDWARPDKVTWLNPGGLGKVRQKNPIVFPTGLDKLMEFAITSIRDTSGVNLELLGLADRDQPGVLEAQRKKAGITILAHMFDSLRLMRRDIGRQLLYYIQENMSDGRLARVVGDGMKQYVPLTRDLTAGEYDVEVDESPTSPNQKDQVFATLTSILPGIMKAGVPVPPDILDYMPLPSTLIDKWKDYIKQQQAQPKQDPAIAEAQAKSQTDQAKIQAEEATKIQIAKMDNETKIIVAKISAGAKAVADGGTDPSIPSGNAAGPNLNDLISAVMQQLQQTFQGIHQSNQQVMQSHQQLAQAMNTPKAVVRDAGGNISHIVPVTPQVH